MYQRALSTFLMCLACTCFISFISTVYAHLGLIKDETQTQQRVVSTSLATTLPDVILADTTYTFVTDELEEMLDTAETLAYEPTQPSLDETFETLDTFDWSGVMHSSSLLLPPHELWQLAQPTRYSMVVEHHCFCDEAYRFPVKLFIEDGTKTSVAYVDSNDTPVPEDLIDYTPSVEELFSWIAQAGQHGTLGEVTFEPVFGHPTTVFFEGDLSVEEDEHRYLISNFKIEN